MDHAQPPTADRLHLPAGQLRIVDAAAEAFMERGYDATSIDEVGLVAASVGPGNDPPMARLSSTCAGGATRPSS